MNPKQLEIYIHNHIPITLAMGVNVVELSANCIALNAPLSQNINHRGAVFGGSLNSLATVCAWSAVFVLLRRRNVEAEVVVRRSETSFFRAAKASFEATVRLPSEAEASRFCHQLSRKKIARLYLEVSVTSENTDCARFSGEFVAILTQQHLH